MKNNGGSEESDDCSVNDEKATEEMAVSTSDVYPKTELCTQFVFYDVRGRV